MVRILTTVVSVIYYASTIAGSTQKAIHQNDLYGLSRDEKHTHGVRLKREVYSKEDTMANIQACGHYLTDGVKALT